MAESPESGAQKGRFFDPFGEGMDEPFSGLLPREKLDELSTLQILDLIADKLPRKHSALIDLVYLRERVATMEETTDQAREALEKYDEIVEKLRAREALEKYD